MTDLKVLKISVAPFDYRAGEVVTYICSAAFRLGHPRSIVERWVVVRRDYDGGLIVRTPDKLYDIEEEAHVALVAERMGAKE